MSGSVALELHEITGDAGPTLAVLGGVHGDEPEGILACDAFVAELRELDRLSGRVLVLPRSNPMAVAADTRTSPDDGENLARVFPGDPVGKPTEQVAHTIFREVITGSDALVDLHSAGCVGIMPFFCGYHELHDECARKAAGIAHAFAAPITWAHDSAAAGRSLSAARSLGIPAIYVESGGGKQVEGEHLDGYLSGLFRVMAHLGMLEAPGWLTPPPAGRRIVRGGYGDIDAAYPAEVAGRWVTRVSVGDDVRAGAVLGELRDDEGRVISTIRAERDSCVMRLRRWCRVEAGEALAMLGPISEPAPAAEPVLT
ncbi:MULTISPECIES: succinylglutamate desuccinylase/aspartoacylase family protein [Amycolatopsis]|uniref:Succinylglutamate desuccinylase/aspartoacylase family protein n=1 Tax=Amycolatopsis dongchuanensis TaxID=1070866 RepID=A0ABP8VJU4_9PSEU|nr:M14 family metallopeptidase [Amycolatopsis sacchari]